MPQEMSSSKVASASIGDVSLGTRMVTKISWLTLIVLSMYVQRYSVLGGLVVKSIYIQFWHGLLDKSFHISSFLSLLDISPMH